MVLDEPEPEFELGLAPALTEVLAVRFTPCSPMQAGGPAVNSSSRQPQVVWTLSVAAKSGWQV